MKRKSLIIFALLLFTIMAFSQDTIKTIQSDIKLHINTRSAKIDIVNFDYYFGAGIKTIIKEMITIDIAGNYERYNSIIYLAHSEKVSHKYGQLGYIYDTEKDIKLFYTSIYYPFLKIFKAGYDFSMRDTINHSIYLGIKWQFISAEIAFFDGVRRFKYIFEPMIKKWGKVSLKAKIEGLYVNKKFKWESGVSLSYKMNYRQEAGAG